MLIRSRAILITLFCMHFLGACKKDNSSNLNSTSTDYYIKFTLDATDMLFVNNAEGNMNVIDGSGKYTFTAAALKIPFVAATNNATLIISSAKEIKTNIVYVNYATTTTGYERPAYATVAYIDAAGTTFASWGDEYKNSGVISDSKITFTEITATNLKGTFSGTIYKSISGTADKHLMSKGEFNLKRR